MFTNAYRFINNLCAINNNSEFEKVFKGTYSPETAFDKENTSNLEALFFIPDTNVKHRKFESQLFDKRAAFSFSFFRMSYQNFQAKVGPNILFFARTTSSKEQFPKIITALLTRMQKLGCQNTQLKSFLNKLIAKHFDNSQRYADAAKPINQLHSLICFTLKVSTGQVIINFVIASCHIYYFQLIYFCYF